MRVLMLVFAGIAVMAGVVSGKLWSDLRAEKHANEELRAQLVAARTHVPQAMLPATTAATPVASAGPATTPSAQAPTLDPQARAAELNARVAASSATLAALTSSLGVSSEQELLKDPEFRKARLAQMRIQIARTYPGLAEELGLSAKEADQFFNLMAENQLKTTTDIASRLTGATDIAELVRRQSGVQKEQDDSIRAMLGSSRYEQYQAYQQTRPARNQVVTMGSQLAAAGAPLSDSQSRALTTVMIAEQQRERQRQQSMQTVNAAGSQPRNTQTMLAESLGRQEETNRRVLEAVGPQLNAKQLATLTEQYEQQNAARRETITRLQGLDQRLGLPAAPLAPAPRP